MLSLPRSLSVYALYVLIASPAVVFAGYIAYLVVPIVVREVVPSVVKSVLGV